MTVLKILAIALFLFAVFALLIRLFENSFIFYPIKFPQGNWQPGTYGLNIEDCYFETADGVKLHGWFMANDDAIGTMLWCHGNAGNISHRLDNISKLSRLPINVFIFDYRGYGQSKGSPSESGIYADALAAYDYLISRPDVRKDEIIIFGRSLGGAVAVDLARQRQCAGLILESAFTSAKDMAKSTFGFLPVHFAIKSRLNAIDKIKQIDVPVLVLHGTADQIVPFELGQKLFAAANPPKEFYSIPNADHNDTYIVGGTAYFDRIDAFIRQALR